MCQSWAYSHRQTLWELFVSAITSQAPRSAGFSLGSVYRKHLVSGFLFPRWTLTSILCTLSGSVCMRITWGGPTPLEFSSQYIWGRTQVCAFLRNSHIMLALVNQGPHLKTTIVKTKNWLSYAGLTPISFFHWAIKSKNTLKFKETLLFSLHLKKLKPLR